MMAAQETPPPVGATAACETSERTRTRTRLRFWRRLLWSVCVVVVALLLLGLVAARTARPADSSSDAQRLDRGPRSGPAPLFAAPDLADPARQISLVNFRGRPLVLNFWASWCAPCRREMPRLAAAARRLRGRVGFLGVNYKDQRAAALRFASQTGVPYPSVVDGSGSVGARYAIYGLPTTVFIDGRGRILGRYLGEMKGGTLERLLAQLMAAR